MTCERPRRADEPARACSWDAAPPPPSGGRPCPSGSHGALGSGGAARITCTEYMYARARAYTPLHMHAQVRVHTHQHTLLYLETV